MSEPADWEYGVNAKRSAPAVEPAAGLNYYNYFTEIEEYFVQKRGRNLMVSPLDWCLIELWKDNQIPVHVVLRGIDRSFESAERSRRKTPTTLFYCHPGVLEAHEEHLQSEVGAATSTPGEEPPLSDDTERSRVEEFLLKLIGRLSQDSGDAFQRGRRRLESLLSEFRENPRLRLREVDQALVQVAELITRALEEEHSREELKQLRKELRAELKIYRRRLDAEMFKKLQQSYFDRRLRELHGLPEFTLFEMG